jgi:hypothetical protein
MPEACLVGPRDSPRWLTLQIGSLVPNFAVSECSNMRRLSKAFPDKDGRDGFRSTQEPDQH